MTVDPKDIIVVIGSVPWREENLRGLCQDFCAQTMLPGMVHLVLDGYSMRAHDGLRHWLDDLSMEWPMFSTTRHETPQGPGGRWRYLAKLATMPDERRVAVIIDDDFRVGPDYVEKTVAGFTSDDVGMVAWSGTSWDTHSKYGIEETDLWCAAAGMSAVRVSAMAGIESYPGVDAYFGVGGDDEALVSYWMWQQKLRVVRPPEPAPDVRSIDAYQFDRRAAHRNHNHRHYIQRIQLLQRHGWAPPTPPPFENPGALRGRQP